MARQLFINQEKNDQVAKKIKSLLQTSTSEFRGELHSYLLLEIKKELKENADEELLKSLYFLGSFSRGLGGYGSDLDLLLISPKADQLAFFNSKIREVFRNYSLRTASSVEDYVKRSDAKGLLSGWFLKPVFDGPDLTDPFRAQVLKQRDGEVLEFLENERLSRQKRFGSRPGRVHFNIKHSPGGLIDLRHLDFLTTKKGEFLDLTDAENFLYKARTLNQFFANSDSLQVTLVKDFKKYFSMKSDRSFYREFFRSVNKVYEELCKTKESSKDESLESLLSKSGLEFAKEELSSVQTLMNEIEGLVLAPSYHTWTADEHTLKCVEEAALIADEYRLEFELTDFEIQVLLWSAFFHDIKKGKSEPHSILGSKAVQEFGRVHDWDFKKTKMVSWLVREHLTLVKYAFKSDPFEPEFLRNLSLRGCTGRKAMLLFLLSCADLKATNPSSWSQWKRRVLKQALGQILGEENKLKNELISSLKPGSKGEQLAKSLRLKEICLVPFELMKNDLQVLGEEGFKFYEYDGKIWVRSYQQRDKTRFAKRFLEGLYLSGAYVQHALFKTIEESGIYNWACVEAGVSLKAFEKRFLMMLLKYEESDAEGPISLPDYEFKKIRLTFLKKSYAVISFTGEDEKGALFEALRILAAYKLNIEWGHAVTWGDEIEDVFGVSFHTEPDWSFLI